METVYIALSKGKESEGYFASEEKAIEVAGSLYLGSVKSERISRSDFEKYHVDTSLPDYMWEGV